MSAVTASLALVALLAGVAGTWSPCGLSTIESLRVGGVHGGGRRTALAAAGAFAAGTLLGGMATFGLLSLAGSALGLLGAGATAAAAVAIAAAGAAAELTGVRVLPQIRRQVPEPWRRRAPLLVAAAAYGVLLGLAFTTFVMSFAVWALAGLCVLLGSPTRGLVVGAAFGAGRALLVLLLAPLVDRPLGARALETMLQRPRSLQRVRQASAAALALCALSLAPSAGAAITRQATAPAPTPGPAPAPAPTTFSGQTDPSAVAGALAWQQIGSTGLLQAGSGAPGSTADAVALPGSHPALGGSRAAWIEGDQIVVADRGTLTPQLSFSAPGADALAVSDDWVVYRVPPASGAAGGSYQLFARPLNPPGASRFVAAAASPAQLGRPALDGSTLVFAAAGRSSRILAVDLAGGAPRVVRSTSTAQLLNPSVSGGQLLYVRVDECFQRVLLGPLAGGRDRALSTAPTQVARDGGYGQHVIRIGRTPHHCTGPLAGSYTEVARFWTTALAPDAAYVTVLRTNGAASTATVQTLPR